MFVVFARRADECKKDKSEKRIARNLSFHLRLGRHTNVGGKDNILGIRLLLLTLDNEDLRQILPCCGARSRPSDRLCRPAAGAQGRYEAAEHLPR